MLHKMTQPQWDQVIAVHLTGAFNCVQAVTPGMMERKYGRIIYVTSAASVLGTVGQINYSAAKASVLGMTKSTAKELARYNITANAIAPGAATPMTEVIRTDERFKEQYLNRISLGRGAEPKEISPVFVFFASDASAYVTGQILAADGGMTIY
jgi:3-oxoacyl-[acyl-carrier protein] reductase